MEVSSIPPRSDSKAAANLAIPAAARKSDEDERDRASQRSSSSQQSSVSLPANHNDSAGSVSPISSLSVPQLTVITPFGSAMPLENIDLDEPSVVVAQERSSIQALKRLSFEVSAASDPDLPGISQNQQQQQQQLQQQQQQQSQQQSFGSIRPSSPAADSDDEESISSTGSGNSGKSNDQPLLWVPAHLHPALAPKEWKTYVQERVSEIQKLADRKSSPSSTNGNSLQIPNAGQQSSSSSRIVRRKSKLSREIDTSGDTPAGYEDGADVLQERKAHVEVTVSDLELFETYALQARSPPSSPSGMPFVRQQSETAAVSPAADANISSRINGRGLRRSTHTLRKLGSQSSSSATASVDDADYERAVGLIQQDTVDLSPPVQARHGILQTSAATSAAVQHVTVEDGKLKLEFDDDTWKFDELEKPTGEHLVASVAAAEDPTTPRSLAKSSDEDLGYYPRPHPLTAAPSLQPPASSQSPAPFPRSEPATRNSLDNISTDSQGSRYSNKKRNKATAIKASFGRLFTSDKEKEGNSSSGGLKSSFNDAVRSTSKKVASFSSASASSFSTPTRSQSMPVDLGAKDSRNSIDSSSTDSSVEEKKKDSKLTNIFRMNRKNKEAKQQQQQQRSHFSKLMPTEVRHRRSSSSSLSSVISDSMLYGISGNPYGRSRSVSPSRSPGRRMGPRMNGGEQEDEYEYERPYYYTRFPLHVERAIYRLSHLKLANPRRPLCQQVLLSNFMYGYLDTINQDSLYFQQQQQQQFEQQQKQQEYYGGGYRPSDLYEYGQDEMTYGVKDGDYVDAFEEHELYGGYYDPTEDDDDYALPPSEYEDEVEERDESDVRPRQVKTRNPYRQQREQVEHEQQEQQSTRAKRQVVQQQQTMQYAHLHANQTQQQQQQQEQQQKLQQQQQLQLQLQLQQQQQLQQKQLQQMQQQQQQQQQHQQQYIVAQAPSVPARYHIKARVQPAVHNSGPQEPSLYRDYYGQVQAVGGSYRG
ncbi:hypothetical protein BZA70DRAFT_31434 [Myxozyma melibiosi]|uniref:Protein Zds1 C-terminal domain-containing protein n=1 Tax=Myxozyma melibiosi TaxID=54550 RepID=A0ABR1FFR1_9ASCO